MFTKMKDKYIINLTEPSKITHKESNQKKTRYEQNTRFPVNKWSIWAKKVKSCGFCNTTNHTAKNILQEVILDSL